MNGSRLAERPLDGLRVMVTRPLREAEKGKPAKTGTQTGSDVISGDDLAGQLGRLGAEVIVQPAIRIGPPADWRPVDAALARLAEFDWLVFSSANGVRYLLDRASEKGTQLFSAGPKKELRPLFWRPLGRAPPRS